jgi:hypothetical protein
MDRAWKRFFWPMTALVVALIAVTMFSYRILGVEFWNTFYPQFLATVFGVVFSIMFAWALWHLQQRTEESHKRQQLFKDLTFEVSENLKWLENLKNFLSEPSRPEYTSLDRGLQTITMKYALNSEKFLLLRDFDLAYEIDRTVRVCEEFNNDYGQRFRKFIIDEAVASTKKDEQQRVREAFSVEILMDVGYYHHILEQLINRLAEQTTRNSDKL